MPRKYSTYGLHTCKAMTSFPPLAPTLHSTSLASLPGKTVMRQNIKQALPLVTDRHTDVKSSPASCPRSTGLIPRSVNRVSFISLFSSIFVKSRSNMSNQCPFRFTQHPHIRRYEVELPRR